MRQFLRFVVLLLLVSSIGPSYLVAQTVADSDVKHVQLRLEAGGSVSGTVQFQFITGKSKGLESQVQLFNGEESVATASTNELGEFELNSVVPGTYVLRVSMGGRTGSLPVQIVPEQTQGASNSFVGKLNHSSELVVGGNLRGDGGQVGVITEPDFDVQQAGRYSQPEGSVVLGGSDSVSDGGFLTSSIVDGGNNDQGLESPPTAGRNGLNSGSSEDASANNSSSESSTGTESIQTQSAPFPDPPGSADPESPVDVGMPPDDQAASPVL